MDGYFLGVRFCLLVYGGLFGCAWWWVCRILCMRVCVCMRACVYACVRTCVRVWSCVRVYLLTCVRAYVLELLACVLVACVFARAYLGACIHVYVSKWHAPGARPLDRTPCAVVSVLRLPPDHTVCLHLSHTSTSRYLSPNDKLYHPLRDVCTSALAK